MTLRDAIESAVSGLYQTTDSLRTAITYHEAGSTTYNPATGATTSSTAHGLRALFYQFRDVEIDGQTVRPTDRRCELDPADLSFAPKPTDWIVAGGDRWEVLGPISGDADVAVVLHVRKAGAA